jgi:hypothetical protein
VPEWPHRTIEPAPYPITGHVCFPGIRSSILMRCNVCFQ